MAIYTTTGAFTDEEVERTVFRAKMGILEHTDTAAKLVEIILQLDEEMIYEREDYEEIITKMEGEESGLIRELEEERDKLADELKELKEVPTNE